MAVALTFPNGFKVSYSGDCRPSKQFANIGRNSTVLIHEATFDDDLQEDAKAKKHSTTSEAVGVAVAMRAKRLILTHFSQRYQKLPNMEGVVNAEVKLEETQEGQDMMDGMDEAVESADALIAATRSMDTQDEVNDNSGNGVSHEPNLDTFGLTKDQQALKDLKIGVAFDYMRVKVGEIAQLEKFNSALVKLFEEPIVEEDKDEENATVVERKEASEGSAKRKKQQNEEITASESKKPSQKALKRKKNKEAFNAAQRKNSTRVRQIGHVSELGISAENKPFGRNAERAERDQAILAANKRRVAEGQTEGSRKWQAELGVDGGQSRVETTQQSPR